MQELGHDGLEIGQDKLSWTDTGHVDLHKDQTKGSMRGTCNRTEQAELDTVWADTGCVGTDAKIRHSRIMGSTK